MSTTKRGRKPLLILTSNTEVKINTKSARFVNADGTYPETEGSKAIGVVSVDVPKGEYAPITTHGIEFITIQEAVSSGDLLTTGSEGKAKKHSGNDRIMGVAIDDGNNGDVSRIKL